MTREPHPSARGSDELDSWGLRVRIAITVAVVVMITLGTAVGDDRWWPFSPMSQYAFAVETDGVINSFVMEADRADGSSAQVALSKQGVGLERAEMEGQLTRFESTPALMQTIAVMHSRTQPNEPKLVTIYLRNKQTDLSKGRRRHTTTLATWQVQQPEDPQAGLEELRRSDSWPPP